MIKFSTIITLFAVLLGTACAPGPHHRKPIMNTPVPVIIPAPAELHPGEGTFLLSDDATMAFHPVFAAEAKLMAEQCGLKLASPLDSSAQIVLLLEEGLPPEGYEMDIAADGILIRASTSQGIWWGGQTLRQLLLDGRNLPQLSIVDAPRFRWRGMLLDCGRHMMSVDYVKQTIDRLSLHRMNVLHWHLVEDQGWRLEIDAYPKLTSVGAWRTNPDGTRYGGFYTKNQVREIVAYAAARHVTVMPEIELPGHCQASLAAYPELSCTGGPFEVQTQWGIFPDIYCAGNDAVFEFLETVLGEVLELFPSQYIHIGGDEAPRARWRDCEKCQARIQAEGLRDEHELQSWFIGRIGQWLEAHGRRMIGWDEILEGGLPDGAAVQSWRGMDGAIAAVKAGHDAVISPTSHCYLDYSIAQTSLRKSYSLEPVPPGLSPEEAAHILGGEANMWTEYAPEDIVDTKIWPRLAGIAERLWSPADRRDFEDFRDRWQHHRSRLESLGVTVGPIAAPVTTSARYEPGLDGWILDIRSDDPDLGVVAGTRSRPPRTADQRVLEPLLVKESQELVFQAFLVDEPWGEPVYETLFRHAALGRAPAYTTPPSSRYSSSGDLALVNGLRASTNHRDGRWVGFEGVDMEATIDLGSDMKLDRISVGFLQDANAWIFPPGELTVEGSPDSSNWKPIGAATHAIDNRDQEKQFWQATVTANGAIARFVRLHARSAGPCPPWHPGAGGESWIFCDEIIVTREETP